MTPTTSFGFWTTPVQSTDKLTDHFNCSKDEKQN